MDNSKITENSIYEKYVSVLLDGRYKIEKLLGTGGMAVVFRAHDMKQDDTVAIKMLRDDIAGDPEALTRFVNESRAVSMLSHPNIVAIRDVSVDTEHKYLVMEYIDGIPLTTFIEQGKLTRALAYKFITETCNALQYIHNKQLIHKDLKPNNILITYNGNNVKLIDFGLADCDDYEILKIPAGTEKYLAPEQLDPNATLDCRTDIYSLGIIIEELATILKDRKLASIAQKCTCQNPNSRFNNTAEIVETLKSKSFGTIYKYAAFIIVSFLIAFLYLQPPFAGNKSPNRNTITQVYSNFSTGNAYHHTLLQEKSRLHRNITRYSANRQDLVQDSLLMYQALRKALNTDYPESDQRETPVYKKLLTNMQLDVKREIKNIREKL